jgi:putative transposase
VVNPQMQKTAVEYILKRYKMSELHSCGLIGIHKSTYRYKSKKKLDKNLRKKIKKIAYKYTRYGYRRIYAVIRNKGLKINHKKIYRLYREMNLSKRVKKKKRINRHLGPLLSPTNINEAWGMDFMSDKLENGQIIKILNIIDIFSRECLKIVINKSLTSKEVIKTLEELKLTRGLPKTITLDNGPEYIANITKEWASKASVKLNYIPPGKPTKNAFIESFNGKFREECLNQNAFINIKEAKILIEQWRQYYNKERPHSSLGYKSPEEYKRNCSYVYKQVANK